MNLLRNSVVGAVISLSISYVIIAIRCYQQNASIGPTTIVNQMILALILGLVIGALTIVFEIEAWSLLRSLSTHFLVTWIVVLIIGYLGDWYIWSWDSVGPLFFYFFIFYIVIGSIQFLSIKRIVEDVNELIQKNKSINKK